MAPEVIHGAYDKRVDIFSFSILLFEMVFCYNHVLSQREGKYILPYLSPFLSDLFS